MDGADDRGYRWNAWREHRPGGRWKNGIERGGLHEARAKALYLLFYCGAQVICRNHCAQTTGGSDRLQSCHANAEDQHTRRSDRSCRGRKHGEQFGQRVRGNQHSLVTRDGGHRGQRVHALGARRSRHELHRERCDPSRCEVCDAGHIAERPQESDENLIAMKQRKVGAAGPVVGAVGQHLDDDVRHAKNLGTLGDNLRTFGHVFGIRVAGLSARARFHDNFHARFCEDG